MSAMLVDRDLKGFADALAAKEPVPGGGGAAAYAGALGVALGSMVANFTLGKRRYAAYEDDLRRILAQAEDLRAHLVSLVDEDAAAFAPLAHAYGIPKSDPSRDEALEAAAKAACDAPLKTMEQVCRAIALLEELGEKGSGLLISDVGAGALLSRAALEAASLSIFVNTRSLKDRAYAEAVEARCDEMLGTWCPRAEALAAKVMGRIREEG